MIDRLIEWVRDQMFLDSVRNMLRCLGAEILRLDLDRDERDGAMLDIVIRARGHLFEQIIYVGAPTGRERERLLLDAAVMAFIAQALAGLSATAARAAG